jgi:hypothetical protein
MLFALQDREQGFTRFYIDKSAADKELADVRQVLLVAENWSRNLITTDVRLTFLRDQIIITFDIADPGLKKILFSIDDPQPKTETGVVPGTTVANRSVTGIVLPVGEHTVYFYHIDANGVTTPVQSKKFRVEPIAIDLRPGDQDFATNTQTVWFAVGVVGAKPTEFYTFKYSVNSPALDQGDEDASFSGITLKGLRPGEYKLYVQGTRRGDNVKTPVVEYAFTIK